MLHAACWKWASMERQQSQDLHISYSRHPADLRVHNCIINRLASQKYHISKVKYRYQITRLCKLLNKQKHIVGCWKCDFDKILLTHCKFKNLIWIYRWTSWATRWQPTQTRTWSDSPEPLLTQTTGQNPDRWRVTRTHCYHYCCCCFTPNYQVRSCAVVAFTVSWFSGIAGNQECAPETVV